MADHTPRKLPREPEAFTEAVARHMASRIQGPRILPTGPFEIAIGEQVVNVNNLYRAVIHQEPDDERESLEQFVDALITAQRLAQSSLPFQAVQSRILPRIHGGDFLVHQRPEFVAHQPFINDTLIVYVIDLEQISAALTTEHMIRWGMDIEKIDELARRNLAQYRPRVELQLIQDEQGSLATLNTGDGYDASRLLLDQLYDHLAPELGGDFLAAIPTQNQFLAFPREPEQLVETQQQRAADQYRTHPYPITSRLFLVTRDGIAEWRDAA